MDRVERLRAAIRRVVDKGVDQALQAAISAGDDATKAGAYGDSRHIIDKRQCITREFQVTCECAARSLFAAEGDGAPEFADLLDAEFAEGQRRIQERIGKGRRSAEAFGDCIQGECEALRAALDKVRADTLNELHLGTVGGESMKPKGGISVDMRGASGQIAVGSMINQNIAGDQRFGIDPAHALEALVAIRAAAAAADLAPEKRETLEDAIISAEREAQEPQSDKSRLRRLYDRVVHLAGDYGVNVAANLTTAALSTPLLLG